MRAALLALPFLLLACATPDPTAPVPDSLRDRLASETHLFIAADTSGGAVSAQRKTDDGWAERLVDLPLDHGELVAHTDGTTLTLDSFELALRPVTIPATLIGHDAQLTDLYLRLGAPATGPATWSDDDGCTAHVTLALELSWKLSVDGVGLPLGAPRLPPLPVTIELTGNGAHVAAEVRIHAPGELWSWAGVVKLADFMLVLGAETAR